MYRRTYLAVLTLQLLLIGGLRAQGGAGQAGEFLRWGVGAKALGLGRAFTSIADDASALYWNPAGLSALSTIGGSFMFMHVPAQEGASFNYLAGAVPLRLLFSNPESTSAFVRMMQEFKFGLGMLWHSLGEFELYDEGGRRESDQSENAIGESAFYLSASYPLNSLFRHFPDGGMWAYLRGDFEVGLTSKFVKQDLFGASGTATSFDLGFKYSHHSGMVSLGLTLRDFGQTSISYADNIVSDKIPATGILGISLRPKGGRLRGLVLAFDYGLVKPSARERDFMFGLEYDLSSVSSEIPVKIRLGANSNYESITFGINFSPELVLGQDWVPYGDLSYANQRGGFRATGTRYTVSIDRNPFTAKYWYRRGMTEYLGSHCDNLDDLGQAQKASRYFKNAVKAKNPGRRAYRFDAALRLADLAFLVALKDLRDSALALRSPSTKWQHEIEAVPSRYTRAAMGYLREDSGKPKIDHEQYLSSFSFYVQSLILSGQAARAVAVCADSGQSWGRGLNVFKGRDGRIDRDRTEQLTYLYALALSESNFTTEASRLILEKLREYPLAKYLMGHIAFLEKEYARVLEVLSDIDLNRAYFPENVFLPLTGDCTFGDEVLFLRAAAMYRMTRTFEAKDFVAEFAKIPRFFPESDLSRFLTDEESLLETMISYYEKEEMLKLESLLNRIIGSYIEAFSRGTLKQTAYTWHYR